MNRRIRGSYEFKGQKWSVGDKTPDGEIAAVVHGGLMVYTDKGLTLIHPVAWS